jgi:flagellar biosynthesis protein FlhF
MKIKRFFSQDMRSAIRMVREELGADAVILSNDRVNGGVEVVAAVDYDETLLDNQAKQQQALPKAPAQAPAKESQLTQSDNEEHIATFEQPIDTRIEPPAAKRKSENPFSHITRALGREKSTHSAEKHEPEFHSRIDAAFNPKKKRSESPYLAPPKEKQRSESARSKESDLNEFYQLEDNIDDEPKIEESLYDISNVSEFPTELVTSKKASGKNSYSVWSQEPTLMAMRNEITTLRGMLEQQLTGLAWGDLERKNPVRAKLIRQLLELGFSPELVDQAVEGVNETNDYQKAWQSVLASVARRLPVHDDDLIMSGGVVALVGATGVGKTTSVAKLAARYALRHGRNNIALITTDTYRIGALEQLRTYGRILGIPVKIAHNKKQLTQLLKMLADKKFVLVDTAGMGQRDVRLMEQFTVINDCAPDLRTLLVLSTATHRTALDEAARVFNNVDINGCILTKLDETTSLGGALSVVTEHRIPVTYISDGQRVPEDLHVARAHTLVNRAIMTARRCRHPLDDESLELAFSRMPSHARA